MRRRHVRITVAPLLCLVSTWADPESDALRSGGDGEAVRPKREEGQRDRTLAKVLREGLRFPVSFEHDGIGSCPAGWTCSDRKTRVCGRAYQRPDCIFPGLTDTDGDRFLAVGDDFGTSEANSSVFTLPGTISSIRLRMGGGADGPSGFYLYSSAGMLLCFIPSSPNRNTLSTNACTDLAGHGGEDVYMQVVDKRRGEWGKVLIDDIRLQDLAGRDLSITGWVFSDTVASTTSRTRPTTAPPATMVTTPTTAAQAVKTVRFNADYDQVVGSHADKFAEECSAAMRAVRCCNVRKGSILVDLEGESADVDASVAIVLEHGLDLPSFPKLTAILEGAWHNAGEHDAGHGLALILGFLAVAGCAVVGFFSSKKRLVEVFGGEESEWQSHDTNEPASGKKVAEFVDEEGQEIRLWVDGRRLHWADMDTHRTYMLRNLDIREAGESGQFCITCHPQQALITSPPPGDEQRHLLVRLAAWAQRAGIPVTGSVYTAPDGL